MTMIGPGVRVKCIKRGAWEIIAGQPVCDGGPEFGSIWTVLSRAPTIFMDGIYLKEWNEIDAFDVRRFVPLDGNEDLSDLIAALKRGADQGDIERKEIVEIAKAIRTGAAEYVRAKTTP